MASVLALGQEPSISNTSAIRLSVPVEGMTCASCVGRVERALKAVPGVQTAAVNLATERADISFSGAPDPQAVVRAIDNVGYAVREETTELAIEGMTCASCVGRVEEALACIPGVLEATVNLATERARIRHLAGIVSVAGLEAVVEQTEYTPRRLSPEAGGLPGRGAERREQEGRALKRSLLVAAVLTLPIFVIAMGSHLVPGMHQWVMITVGERTSWYFQFALATLVLFGPGLRFFEKGVLALLRRAPDMNSLVAVGTSAAYAAN